MASSENNILCQYGALPFLMTEEGEIRLLLVTTRGQRGWIIPKGWPIRHLTAAGTAAREAYEEAGVIGTIIGDRPCGSFIYEKRASSRGRMVWRYRSSCSRSNGSFANGRRSRSERPAGSRPRQLPDSLCPPGSAKSSVLISSGWSIGPF